MLQLSEMVFIIFSRVWDYSPTIWLLPYIYYIIYIWFLRQRLYEYEYHEERTQITYPYVICGHEYKVIGSSNTNTNHISTKITRFVANHKKNHQIPDKCKNHQIWCKITRPGNAGFGRYLPGIADAGGNSIGIV
jgi:hypothetical protein